MRFGHKGRKGGGFRGFGFEDEQSPRGGRGGGRGQGRGRGAEGGRRHGRGGRGGRGGRRVFDAAELRLVTLKLILDEPRHGYDLIRAIEELSGGVYAPSPGVIYPALSLLEDQGHIQALEAEGARKAFSATSEGEAELSQKADEAAALIKRLEVLASEENRLDAAPIRRAMHSLRTALHDRLGREDADMDTVHAAAAALDEAAQKIERL